MSYYPTMREVWVARRRRIILEDEHTGEESEYYMGKNNGVEKGFSIMLNEGWVKEKK